LNLFSWLVVTGYLLWGSNPRYRLLGLGVMPVAAVLLTLAWAGGGTGVDASVGAGWALDLHVGLMLAAFASFTVAAAVAGLYLFEERRLKRRDARLLRLRLPSLSARPPGGFGSPSSVSGCSARASWSAHRLDAGDVDLAMTITLGVWVLTPSRPPSVGDRLQETARLVAPRRPRARGAVLPLTHFAS
jgi:ABC-type transport system involved in cytochrome c biogenesis permease subunit